MGTRKLDRISELFEAYKDIDEEKLWEHFSYFINSIIPTAERCGIKMAIHPDDPPYSIFNLPRIITGPDSYDRMFSINGSPSNALTLCTGSMGASKKNNMTEIVKNYHHKAPFIHLRNVHIYEDHSFVETSHYDNDGDIELAEIMKILAASNYQGYIRPDHGRHLWNENCRPGYGLYDRALGIMYLNGLWTAFQLNKEGAKMFSKHESLNQKVVVITGGSGVLCRTIAKELARQNMKIAILNRNFEKGKEIVDSIKNDGGVASNYAVDVTNEEDLIKAKLDILSDYGQIDHLINGAGGNNPAAITNEESYSTSDSKSFSN